MESESATITDAFSIIRTAGGDIIADRYNDIVTLVAGSGITITPNTATNELTFTASGSSLSEQYCTGTNKFRAYNATLNTFVCATDETGAAGDATSAVNVGTGIGVFQTEVGDELRFHSLLAGSGITIMDIGNEVQINSTGGTGETNIGENVGTGDASVYAGKSGVNLQFKRLDFGQGITFANNTNDIDIDTSFRANSITCSGTDKVSAYNNSTGVFTCSTDQSGGASKTLAGQWSQSMTKTNIGTGFTNIYSQTNANGKQIPIDTTGFTDVRLYINWNKIGSGTQTVQVINGACVLVSIDVIAGSNDSGFVDIPACAENSDMAYRLQGKSTTSADDPIFESASIHLQ